jgi:hypothetical protein
MAMTPAKRERIVELVVNFMNAMDATGKNGARYARELGSLSDGELGEMLERMRASDEEHFYLEVTPFNNEPSLEQIEAAAEMVGVKLHEYVYFRHDGTKDDPVRTRFRVPVGYLHVRRLQQILAKKTSYSTDVSRRSQITGQLIGDSAVGRLADEEAYALRTVGATDVLRELLGPRADNRDKRLQMYQAIERDGFVRAGDLVGDTKNQASLNYLDTVLLAAGLRSDLVNPTEVLRATVERPPA